jgi:hypothetical protein
MRIVQARYNGFIFLFSRLWQKYLHSQMVKFLKVQPAVSSIVTSRSRNNDWLNQREMRILDRFNATAFLEFKRTSPFVVISPKMKE